MGSLVSVVIPTYNRANFLYRTLQSVRAQTYHIWEVIVIDNHSQDNTDEVVKGFRDPRINLIKIHNQGVIAASRNLGIRQSSGEWVAFLDSDDWWTVRKLEESVKYLHQGADVVYHDLFLVRGHGQKLFFRKARTRSLKSPVFDDLIKNGNALNNSSVVVSRELLNKINGFSEDPDLVATEDYDGWLRISKITERFKRIPETLGYYWGGGGNMSNPDRLLKNIKAIEKRYTHEILNSVTRSRAYWMDYAKGRMYYLSAAYEMAKKNLKLIKWRQAPLLTFIKSRFMLLMIKLHYSRI